MPRPIIEAFRSQQVRFAFAIGWVLLLFTIFTCGNIQRTRYFLPAYPFLGLIYAMPLVEALRNPKSASVILAALKLLYASAIVLGTGVALFGVWVAPTLVIAGVFLAGAAAVLLLTTNNWPAPQRIAAAAGYIILVFSVDLLLITPTFTYSPAPEITNRLLTDARPRLVLPMAGMDVGIASQIRMLSAGKIDPYIVADNQYEAALNSHGQLICTDDVLKLWRPARVTVERCATGSTRWKLRDYIALFRATDKRAFLESKRVPYYLITVSESREQTPGASE